MPYERRATHSFPTTPTTGIPMEIQFAYGDREALVAAAKAYREEMGLSLTDRPAYEAARAMVRRLRPHLSHDDAGRFAVLSTSYAARRWPRWFWKPQRLEMERRRRLGIRCPWDKMT